MSFQILEADILVRNYSVLNIQPYQIPDKENPGRLVVGAKMAVVGGQLTREGCAGLEVSNLSLPGEAGFLLAQTVVRQVPLPANLQFECKEVSISGGKGTKLVPVRLVKVLSSGQSPVAPPPAK